MIKNNRTSYGLDKRFAQINEFEESGVFEIRMPLDFKLGKNELKLKLLPNKLLKGSEVLIDIFDKNGNSIYYEISKIANEDESRSLIVFIYEDTVPGKCKIYLGATLANEKSYLCQLTSDFLTSVENIQEIKFSEEPKVKYTEKQVQTQVFSTVSRKVGKLGTGDISIVSSIAPKSIERDSLAVEKREVSSVKSTTNLSNNIGSGSTFEIPTYFQPSTITARNFPFSSSMEGGTIFVNRIQLEVPKDNNSALSLFQTNFSASILSVISTSSIEIYPPFRKTVNYRTTAGIDSTVTYDRFFNHGNFTCSYSEILTLATSGYSQSYAVFDLANIQPEVGDVDAVEISYKSLNLIGSNYQPVGTFEIKSENLLIDSSSVFFKNPEGIVETPIGNFRSGLTAFNQYWSTSSIGPNLPTASISSRIVDGIKIDYGIRPNTGSFAIIEPKNQYKITSEGNNSQFSLTFDSFSESDLAGILPQLDVYISGSEIISEPNRENIQLNPIVSSSLGTYIGSVSEKFGKLRKNSLTFVSKNPGNIIPKLVSRAGKWHLGNFEIKSDSERGFNPNQVRIYAPMSLPTGSEVNFKIDYLNPIGRKNTNFSTVLEGVFFQGSTIRSGNASTGSGGTVVIPPGTVSGSDQLTSSYDNRYERKGTGLLSSSNQIASDISGSFVSASNSLSNRINVYDGKTLFSGSSQVIYNQITGIPNTGSFVPTSSYQNDSGSWNTKIDYLNNSTGSFVRTGSYNIDSGSWNTKFLNLNNATSSYEVRGNNIVSSSNQVKNLLPTGVASGSEQFTSSYDGRFERRGSGIYSSSGQLGPTGIYSGSGEVPRNTVVLVNNIKFKSSPNSFSASINSQYDVLIGEGLGTDTPSSGSYSLSTGNSGDSERSYLNLNGADASLAIGYTNSASAYRNSFAINQLAGQFISGSESTRFILGGQDGAYFEDNRTVKKGIEYDGNYSASLINRDRSIPDVGLVKLLISSSNIPTGSFATTGSNQFNGNQSISGSLIVSQNIIGNLFTGSFSGSFHGQYSSSQQVDYDQILNKPIVSGSGLHRILISSGSASSSYSHQNLTYNTSQSKFQVTGSTNLNGNLFMTGSTSTRFSYTWDGPKTVGLTPGIVWTNMENATNIWLGTGPSLGQDAMYIGDFTEITQGRLFTAMGVAAAGPTSSLEVQYSLDGLTSWTPMITLAIGNTTGIKDSNWIRIPAGSQQFTYIRLVGYGGNGVADPRFSPPIALFR